MEIIILLVAVVLAVAIYFGRKKPVASTSVDSWEPPKELHLTEEPAPSVAVEAVTTVVENKPAKKAAAKKAPAKKAAAKKAPATKKSPKSKKV